MSPDPRPPDAGARLLATLGFPMMGLLVVEFLAGMALNLLVPPAPHATLATLAASPVLDLHLALAVPLLGIAGRASYLAGRAARRGALAAALFALASGLVAALAGLAFTFGTASDAMSFGMAAGFAGYLVGAVGLLAATRGTGAASGTSPAPIPRTGA